MTIPSNKDQKVSAESSGVKYEELSMTLQYLNKVPRFVYNLALFALTDVIPMQ